MVEVNEKPILTHCLGQFVELIGAEFVVVMGYLKEKIIDHSGDEYRSISITYAH